MRDIFLFGTLCWRPLLDLITAEHSGVLLDATADGYKVYWAQGQEYPTIVAKPQHTTQGVLLHDCPPCVRARLDFYESIFGYELRPVTVQTKQGEIKAHFYFPPQNTPKGGPWDLAQWVKDHGALALEAAHEIMHYHGDLPAEKIAPHFEMIKARASYRLNAQNAPSLPSPFGLTAKDVRVNSDTIPYAKFFALQDYNIDVPSFDGVMLKGLERATLIGADAAIVLPYDPHTDQVMLIEQFRIGPFARKDPNPWMLEPVAGRIDPNETPEIAAQREMQEEAHLEIKKLHKVHSGYTSPGSTTDYFNVFVAEVHLQDVGSTVTGLESENESIRTYVMPFTQFFEMLKRGDLAVTPLALAGYWLALKRQKM